MVLRRLLRGHADVAIAEAVGVHRNTIRAWKRRSEFREEFRRVAEDRATTMRLRRMTETGAFIDAYATAIAHTLERSRVTEAIEH